MDWRTSTGPPLVVYTGEIDSDEIRMLPTPSTATTGAWIYSRRLTSQHEYTVPDYMALYIVFAMLEREYSYPSNKQDKEFSESLSDAMATMCNMITAQTYYLYNVPKLIKETVDDAENLPPFAQEIARELYDRLVENCDDNAQTAILKGKEHALEAVDPN